MQSRRMSGSSSSSTSASIGKHSSSDCTTDQAQRRDDLHCMGCNRTGHLRESCNFRTQPDFNHNGKWEGCKADRELRARSVKDRDHKLTWKYRADGTRLSTGPVIRLPHLVVPVQTMEIQDDDVIVIAVEEVVGAERAVDMSIGAGTKVQLVSPVSSPT
jgi:hypothetical protein